MHPQDFILINPSNTLLHLTATWYELQAADNRIINTGISNTSEEYIPDNGVIRIFLSTKSPWRDAQGNIIGVIGIARDITERKSAEAALHESEAQYRRLIETAAEGIWILDAEGKTSFVNPKMAQMLGYTVEEMIAMPLFAFMDAQGQAIATEQLERRCHGIAPCEIAIREGIAYYPYGLQQVFPLNQDLAAMQAESYLGAAFLDISGVAIGHIAVFDTKPLLAEERAEAILSIFAACATAELQRQRTEDALRQSERQFRELASKETLLNRLASQIRASLDINQILENAVTEVRNLLQLDMCVFSWYRAESVYWLSNLAGW
jgi:hypothetical protein